MKSIVNSHHKEIISTTGEMSTSSQVTNAIGQIITPEALVAVSQSNSKIGAFLRSRIGENSTSNPISEDFLIGGIIAKLVPSVYQSISPEINEQIRGGLFRLLKSYNLGIKNLLRFNVVIDDVIKTKGDIRDDNFFELLLFGMAGDGSDNTLSKLSSLFTESKQNIHVDGIIAKLVPSSQFSQQTRINSWRLLKSSNLSINVLTEFNSLIDEVIKSKGDIRDGDFMELLGNKIGPGLRPDNRDASFVLFKFVRDTYYAGEYWKYGQW